MSPDIPDSRPDDSFVPLIVSQRGESLIRLIAPGTIHKSGPRVRPAEAAALRLVKQYTDVPVPVVGAANFTIRDGRHHGAIIMDEVADSCALNTVWDTYDSATKERVCRELWAMIKKFREIPKPSELEHLYQCSTDGSPSYDVLLRDPRRPATPLTDDASLRAWINELYLLNNGGSYREHLPDFLPHSDKAVFTHGDISPRNIMVNSSATITGLIDWENSGWYPDYWEFANLQKPSRDLDWMEWMDRTKPEAWDITGIAKARRVLF
ncbi:kinase-like domain-containing protein [Nemania sp. NC0429]|nr:kinase-like domain-containing protein [Nemania sp. NC0429]